MIHPNLLAKLTFNDAKVIQKIVMNTTSETMLKKWILDKESITDMLDNDLVYEYLIQKKSKKQISAALYYYIIIRRALVEHGVDATDIAEYMASLVEEFSIGNRAFKIATHDDDQYEYLIDLSKDIQIYGGDRAFLLSSHLGNYALWISGIFPQYIDNKGISTSYYDMMGIRGFKMASVHPMAKQYDLIDVLEGLSASYIDIRRSLNDLATVVNFSQ